MALESPKAINLIKSINCINNEFRRLRPARPHRYRSHAPRPDPLRRLFLVGAAGAAGAASALAAPSLLRAEAPTTVRIGFQRSSTLISLLKSDGSLEKALGERGVKVS